MDNLVLYIESLVFASEQPITRQEIKYALENSFGTKLSKNVVEDGIEQLIAKYDTDDYSIEVREVAGGLQFLTKPAFHRAIGSHLRQRARWKAGSGRR